MVLVVRLHGGPAEIEVPHLPLAHVELDHVLVLREDHDLVVRGRVLQQTGAPCFGVLPPLAGLHATVEEHDGLAVVAGLAGVWDVNVADIAHLGSIELGCEGTLVECVEVTELGVVEGPLIQGLGRGPRLQHVVGQVVAAVAEHALLWRLEVVFWICICGDVARVVWVVLLIFWQIRWHHMGEIMDELGRHFGPTSLEVLLRILEIILRN